MKTTLLTAFTNELSLGADGYAQLAPIGDFPGVAFIADPQARGGFRKAKAIQRVDAVAVADMVNEYQASRKGITRFLRSRPIFKGHPDVPGNERRYPDKTPKGVIANVVARSDGLYGEPILTHEGEQLVTQTNCKFPSARWEADEVGEENGLKIYRPSRLLSVGLTPSPNLPVQMMNEMDDDGDYDGDHDADEQMPCPHCKKSTPAKPGACSYCGQAISPHHVAQARAQMHNDLAAKTAADAETKTTRMIKTKLLAVLHKLGITVANDATDEQLAAAVDDLGNKAASAATLATEKTSLANSVTSLESAATARVTEIGALRTERDNLKTSFDNERKARIDDELGAALRDGRVLGADAPAWRTRLENPAQFDNELKNLRALKPIIKTRTSFTRGTRTIEIANAAQRRQALQEVIAEICAERKWDPRADYDKAFAEAQKQHPAIFESMAKPGKA